MKITKAVIPAAGLGTRLLPFTKSVPKELIPLLDAPALQYILEEAIASQIKEFCIIKNQAKEALVHFLDPNTTLERELKARHKEHLLDSINKILKAATFTYIYQV